MAAKAEAETTSAISGKLEAEVELKAPPAKLYNVYRKSAHQIPTHTPSKIQSIKVHQGDWESHGTIKIWNYTLDGKEQMFKERVEFDDGKKTVKVHGLEGDVMKLYKVYNGIFEFVSMGNGDQGVAKLTIEYEKLDPNFPPPTKFMDFVVSFVKDIDAGLAKAEGKAEVLKERVEFDDEEKTIKLNGLEGDPMKIYKVFNPMFKLVSGKEEGGGRGGGVAKLSIEYEKLDSSSPPPTKYMDFMISLTNETDDGLVKAV